MNRKRWDRVVALFEAALALPPEERAQFVIREAGADGEMRRQVEAMLAADGGGGGVLDRPPAPQDHVGDRIGPYRIVEELGRGGMGTVYRARRDDVGLEVALKVVAASLGAPERVSRFHAERRLLAALEHPSIARLLDAGVLDDGTPWFAMELVGGLPLDVYCRRRELDVSARVRIFDQACAAVEFAHRRFIVHRDLKPANILVTADGVPKLLDFGIAKLMDSAPPAGDPRDDAPLSDALPPAGELPGDDVLLTRAGARPLTPGFAAPEQILGDPVTAAGDVYALGMILYELLTGRPAYTLEGRTAESLAKEILEVRVRPPSQADHPRSLMATLGRVRRRELDALLLKALEREPDRRYPSAEQLRQDLANYLTHRPLGAHPPSRAYRLDRFVRRHRGAMAAAVGTVVLGTGFATAMAAERQATARERDRAQVEAATAHEVSAFLASLFEASDPYQGVGGDTPVRELLAHGRQRLTDLDDAPEVRARLEHTLGAVHLSLGEYGDAESLFASALERRRQILAHDDLDVAESELALARAYSMRGALDSARVLLDRASATYQAYGTVDPRRHGELAMELGTLLHRQADYPAAERAYREALDHYRAGLSGPDTRIARAEANLANTLSAQRRLAEAEGYNRAAVASFQALPGDQSSNLAQAYNNLGVTLVRQGRLAEGEEVQRQALEIKRTHLPPGHASIGVTLTNLGGILTQLGRLDEAELLLAEALELQRAAVGPTHRYVINALTDLARLDTHRGDHGRALERLEEARRLLVQTVEDDHPRVATLLLMMGNIHRDAGHAAQAEPRLRRALEIRAAALGPSAPQTRAVQVALAGTLIDLARLDEAESHLHAARVPGGTQDEPAERETGMAGDTPAEEPEAPRGFEETLAEELARLRQARGVAPGG